MPLLRVKERNAKRAPAYLDSQSVAFISDAPDIDDDPACCVVLTSGKTAFLACSATELVNEIAEAELDQEIAEDERISEREQNRLNIDGARGVLAVLASKLGDEHEPWACPICDEEAASDEQPEHEPAHAAQRRWMRRALEVIATGGENSPEDIATHVLLAVTTGHIPAGACGCRVCQGERALLKTRSNDKRQATLRAVPVGPFADAETEAPPCD